MHSAWALKFSPGGVKALVSRLPVHTLLRLDRCIVAPVDIEPVLRVAPQPAALRSRNAAAQLQRSLDRLVAAAAHVCS